jgi:hypothetical protein
LIAPFRPPIIARMFRRGPARMRIRVRRPSKRMLHQKSIPDTPITHDFTTLQLELIWTAFPLGLHSSHEFHFLFPSPVVRLARARILYEYGIAMSHHTSSSDTALLYHDQKTFSFGFNSKEVDWPLAFHPRYVSWASYFFPSALQMPQHAHSPMD